jgi:hypothetical protein
MAEHPAAAVVIAPACGRPIRFCRRFQVICRRRHSHAASVFICGDLCASVRNFLRFPPSPNGAETGRDSGRGGQPKQPLPSLRPPRPPHGCPMPPIATTDLPAPRSPRLLAPAPLSAAHPHGNPRRLPALASPATPNSLGTTPSLRHVHRVPATRRGRERVRARRRRRNRPPETLRHQGPRRDFGTSGKPAGNPCPPHRRSKERTAL